MLDVPMDRLNALFYSRAQQWLLEVAEIAANNDSKERTRFNEGRSALLAIAMVDDKRFAMRFIIIGRLVLDT